MFLMYLFNNLKMALCPNPTAKMNNFGIETACIITWTGWVPGKEYTKTIVLKNLNIRAQKLKFKYGYHEASSF